MRRETPSIKVKELLPDLLLLLLIAAGAVYLSLVPAEELGFGVDFCVFKALTHKACPGCGMTRAGACLMHGNISRAIHYNPFILIVFPLMAYLVVIKFYKLASGVRKRTKSRTLER